MAKQKMEINGRYFELEKAEATRDYSYHTLDYFYNRPSTTKQEIYKDWCEWFASVGSLHYGVTGGNCNFFTMGGIFNWNGVDYKAVITYAHNRLYRLP